MHPVTRRDFLKQASAIGISAVAAGSFPRHAVASNPVKFSGWTFKPDTVKDYVDFYNKTYKAQVQYEPVPWPQYHPTMETRAFAGEVVDVMGCTHDNRERWFESGMIRALDDLPGINEIKNQMRPANLDSLMSKDGTQLTGLPYFTSLIVCIYNEPMLQEAGFSGPAKTWDELIEQCTKLKKDKMSDYPFLPNLNAGLSGTMLTFYADCFSEGAHVFDEKNNVIADQEPGVARVIERYQKAFKAGLINPEVLTKTSSTDTHRLFWTGRYAYITTHSYYLRTIAGEPENSKLAPKKAKMTMYPGTGNTYMWTDSYVLSANTKVIEDAWKFMKYLGGNLHGDWYVQKQWIYIAGLDNPYPAMYKDPKVIESFDKWTDLDMLLSQYEKGRVIAAYKEPWYGEFCVKAVAIVQNMIRGKTTAADGLKELAKMQKSLS